MLTRRCLLAAPAILTAATAPITPAFARAPLPGPETPPLYRFKVGAFTVTAITDGTLGLGPELFPAAQQKPQEAAQLLSQAALPPQGPIRTFVNAFVINTGDRLALVDTGLGPGPASAQTSVVCRKISLRPASTRRPSTPSSSRTFTPITSAAWRRAAGRHSRTPKSLC